MRCAGWSDNGRGPRGAPVGGRVETARLPSTTPWHVCVNCSARRVRASALKKRDFGTGRPMLIARFSLPSIGSTDGRPVSGYRR
jgi:hypothetical protein